MNALILGLLLTGCGPKPQDIADQLSSTNPAVREDTTKRAGSYDDEVVIAALIKSLDDPSENSVLTAMPTGYQRGISKRGIGTVPKVEVELVNLQMYCPSV